MKWIHAFGGLAWSAVACLLILAGALFLAGCGASDSGSHSGVSNAPTHEHHH